MFDAILDTVFNDPFCSVQARFIPGEGDVVDPVRVTKRDGDQTESVLGQTFSASDIEIRVRSSEVAKPVKGDRFEVDGIPYQINAAPIRDARRTQWICACCEVS